MAVDVACSISSGACAAAVDVGVDVVVGSEATTASTAALNGPELPS